MKNDIQGNYYLNGGSSQIRADYKTYPTPGENEKDEEEDEREIYDDEKENPTDFDDDFEEEYRLMASNRDDFYESGYEGF
jgi:hypothetical protein